MDMAALQERMEGLYPGLLGLRLTEATPDKVCAALPLRPDLCTNFGIIHGGAIMGFADTVGAMATVLNLPPGAGTTTIESKTNFLRALACEGEATAECTPLHKGRRTMVWQTRIFDAKGKLVAVVTQTQMILEPKG